MRKDTHRAKRNLPQKRPQGKKKKQKKALLPTPRLRDAALEEKVLETLQGCLTAITPADIAGRMGISEGIAQQMLLALAYDGKIAFTRQGMFATPQAMGYKVCRVQKIQRGGAYLIAVDGTELRAEEEALCGAMHGDTVWAMPKRAGEGTVVRVTVHANETMAGRESRNHRFV